MQNVEFKAELRDPALARTICAGVGAAWAERLEQTDTYFRVADGRLKRRETRGRPTEWVCYSRPVTAGAKVSEFALYSEERARERYGKQALPVWVVVKKSRDLWLWQGVRIHIDSVEGLGSFVEFEALVTPDRNLAEARGVVERLRQQFAPALGEPIACGYADLVARESETGGSKGLPPGTPTD